MVQALFTKIKFLQALKLKFARQEIEQNYRSLREENAVKDFKLTVVFLAILNIITFIFGAINEVTTEMCVSGSATTVLILAYCGKKYLIKYHQLATLVLIVGYNVSRIALIPLYLNDSIKTRLFYLGYGMASTQAVLILRLITVSHKIVGVLIAFILRYVSVAVFIEPGAFNLGVCIRQFLIDSFTVYTIFTQEKIFRKIYQDFRQKKEELLKFKELLADYLPQSLVVVTHTTTDLLFWNKAFENTFDFSNEPNQDSLILNENSIRNKFNSLLVDLSTIRGVAISGLYTASSTDLKCAESLGEVLQKIIHYDYLNIKTISLAASIYQENNRRLFEVTIQKVKWDCEDAIAILFNDITYQEKLMALKLANVNKDKVIATVSHELRTPLNGIIGILDITEKKVENSKVAEYLSLCKDNAHLLLSLVNSILDLQQISAGKLKLNPVNVDIRKVFKGLTQLFYFQCKQKNISLECDISKNVPTYIFTDENRFKQIIINLVGNAIKFTSRGGINIKINLNPENIDSLQVTVSDTGIGIKREDLKRLFQMYSRIEDGESVNKNGAGLGLTISNALVTLLNGNLESRGISVDSEYGIGTAFSFEIHRNLTTKPPDKSIVGGTASRKQPAIAEIVCDPNNENTHQFLIPKTKTYDGIRLEEERDSFFDLNENDFYESFSLKDLDSKIQSYTSPIRRNSPDIILNECKQVPILGLQSRKVLSRGEKLSKYVLMKEKGGSINKDKCDHSESILIVDDNPFNLLVATNLVQECGYNTMTALSGQGAIDIIKQTLSEGRAFKAIFMDCQMPIMDGFETTAALKAMMNTHKISNIPILGWTANNSDEDVKRCYEAGMVGYIPKPAVKLDFSKAISSL